MDAKECFVSAKEIFVAKTEKFINIYQNLVFCFYLLPFMGPQYGH